MQLSEWLFAGIYAGEGVQRLSRCKTLDLKVPSRGEVVLEGTITPGEVLPDGPASAITWGSMAASRTRPWCAFTA